MPIETDDQGRFVRQPSPFRNWVTADGRAGPSGDPGFAAEEGRYHLYVSYGCPWAHRTLIGRALKRLEGIISLSVVHYRMGENGWSFEPGPGVVPDPINGARYLSDVYKADGRPFQTASTPVLWDRTQRRIVSNESGDILRMFNSAFDALLARRGELDDGSKLDLYPPELRREIDEISSRMYDRLNNGVYMAGFAATQAAYEDAARGVFAMLDELEARLAARRFLCGRQLTEADIRLFVTLMRFDAAYFGHFKCNLRRLSDYPALFAHTRELYQWPRIGGTVNLEHIKRHYYESHPQLDPTGIVPIGPELDFTAPPGREALP